MNLAVVTCGTKGGFAALGSASAYSALTGVLAGVLFTGVVLMVGFDRTSDQAKLAKPDRQTALALMIPSFLVLVIASFLYGLMGGEEVCTRLDFEGNVAAVLFAVGGTATFQAIAWMIHSMDSSDRTLRSIGSVCQLTITLLVVSQLVVVIDDFQDDYQHHTTWLQVGNYALGALAVVAVCLAWRRGRARDAEQARQAGGIAARSLVVALVIAVILLQAAIYPDRSAWEDPASMPALVIIATAVLAASAYAVLAMIARATPPFAVNKASGPNSRPLRRDADTSQ